MWESLFRGVSLVLMCQLKMHTTCKVIFTPSGEGCSAGVLDGTESQICTALLGQMLEQWNSSSYDVLWIIAAEIEISLIRILRIWAFYLSDSEHANIYNCCFRTFKASSPQGQPQNGLYCIRNSSTKPGKVTCNC